MGQNITIDRPTTEYIPKNMARDVILDYFFEHKDSKRLREEFENIPSIVMLKEAAGVKDDR